MQFFCACGAFACGALPAAGIYARRGHEIGASDSKGFSMKIFSCGGCACGAMPAAGIYARWGPEIPASDSKAFAMKLFLPAAPGLRPAFTFDEFLK